MANNQLTTTTQAQDFKTSLIKAQDRYLTMIENQMVEHRIVLDEYQKTCVMNAISAIANVMDKTGVALHHTDVDQAPITQILLTVAALRLNAAATPREVYFQMRNTKKTVRAASLDKRDDTEKWMKVVEMGIEGDGNDALLRRFGAGIEKVYPCWVVREGDPFTPPIHNGLKIDPPTWTPSGAGRVKLVVYPVKMKDGSEEYFISYMAEVKENLLAHISNNLMNETFNLCADRFKASDKQKEDIAKKKREIMSKAYSMEIDEILDSAEFESWISPAWREHQSRERMFVRKVRNNIVKKIPKDFGSGFVAAQYDQTSEDIDERPVTKDIGGDPEQEPPKVIDITPGPEQPKQPEQTQAPAPEVKPVEKVKPPKIHPQPQTKQEEPVPPPPEEDPFQDAAKAIEDSQQIGF